MASRSVQPFYRAGGHRCDTDRQTTERAAYVAACRIFDMRPRKARDLLYRKLQYNKTIKVKPNRLVSTYIETLASVSISIMLMPKFHETDQTRLCRWSGRVVSFLNSTTRSRPDQNHRPRGSPTSPRTLSGRRLVRSISTCTDFVRGSGLVGSQTKSVGPCGEI